MGLFDLVIQIQIQKNFICPQGAIEAVVHRYSRSQVHPDGATTHRHACMPR